MVWYKTIEALLDVSMPPLLPKNLLLGEMCGGNLYFVFFVSSICEQSINSNMSTKQ